jgi:hypothetical protein
MAAAYKAESDHSRASPEVLNQPAELVDYNLFSSHSALAEALAREGASGDLEALTARVLSL